MAPGLVRPELNDSSQSRTARALTRVIKGRVCTAALLAELKTHPLRR